MPLVVGAPDKMRGTATAAEVAAAVERAAFAEWWDADLAPVADGGEGFLDVLPGRVRSAVVRGPLGAPVEAEWKLDGRTAYVESARAAGLVLAGGAEGNEPMTATTYGVGQLVGEAVQLGARRVFVGLGGSATTDGGEGFVAALEPVDRLRGVELVAACDVDTPFTDAAVVFGPQKGASPAQIRMLTRRLERVAQVYEERFGVDLLSVVGAGAAGGLAGAIAALGGSLVRGFDVVAEALDLAERIAAADFVVTGEGYLDDESFHGKAVGGVVALAAAAEVPVLVVAGDADDDVAGQAPPDADLTVVSLVERFGQEAAWTRTAALVEEVVREALRTR